MARNRTEHAVPDLEQGPLEVASRNSQEALATRSGVVWIKSYLSEDEGKIYCEYIAARGAEGRRARARRTEPAAAKASEVVLEINPDMFL